MLRKIFICAALVTALIVAGCGEEKIAGTPEKAVLACAEIIMTGDSENLAAAGYSADDKNELRQAVTNNFIKSMKKIAPLSDESAQILTQVFFDKTKGNVEFKTTLKSDGDKPVVELTTTPIDQAATAKTSAADNSEIIALVGMVGKLKADGATEDQLKSSPDVQKLAVSALTKYIDGVAFQPEKTFEITCQKVSGSDGTAHWAPVDGKALIDSLSGQ